MDRKAVLIEASKLKDHDDLPGARVDVANFKTYLMSAIGGAWEESEILNLSHPAKSVLETWIKLAGHYDYSFVAFSGHGYHARGKSIDETRLCINDEDEVAIRDLNPGSPWSLITADACRKVILVEELERAKAFQFSLEAKIAKLRPNRQRCRAMFDAAMREAERGAIYFYSCGLNEAAGESKTQGGFFSRALVDVGNEWADRDQPGTLPTNRAFAAAAAVTTRRNAQQHPESEAGRRLNHFPFTVLAH